MQKKVFLLLVILSMVFVVSCGLDEATTTTTLPETTTTTTTLSDLTQYQAQVDVLLQDYTTYPTWYYESRFHLYEDGFGNDEGVWYTDQLSIDFQNVYAFRHIASNTQPSHYEGYVTYLNEVYEEVNGCIAQRQYRGIDVSFDRFASEGVSFDSLVRSIPTHPFEILTILAIQSLVKVEENHYRVSVPMSEFENMEEFVGVFDKYKYGVVVDYTEELFQIDIYFETEQVRIVALIQNTKSGTLYDYDTTIYIRHMGEVTPFTVPKTVDYVMFPDDTRLISSSLLVPASMKIYLVEKVYGFIRVDLEVGTYRVNCDDIYGDKYFTNIQLFDADMNEIWGNSFYVQTAGTYYIRLESPYENNITKLTIVIVE